MTMMRQERKAGQFGDLIEQELRKKSEEAVGHGLRSETLHSYDLDQFYPEPPKSIRDSFNFFEMNETEDGDILAASKPEKKHSVAGRMKSLSFPNFHISASSEESDIEEDKNSTRKISMIKHFRSLLPTYSHSTKTLRKASSS